MTSADLSSLRELAEKASAWAVAIDNDGTPSQVGPTPDELRAAAAAILAMIDEVERLRKALEPFAAAIDRYDAEWDDKSGSQAREPDEEKVAYLGWLGDYFDMVTLGNFRAARQALTRSHPNDKRS